VFDIPGMGWTLITAILGRDYAVVQGATLTFAFFVSIINIFSDIVYSLLDPRVSL
jgi:peptide/nickel transport system permease protein